MEIMIIRVSTNRCIDGCNAGNSIYNGQRDRLLLSGLTARARDPAQNDALAGIATTSENAHCEISPSCVHHCAG